MSDLITMSSAVKRPAEDNDIFLRTASEVPPVLKLNFVALDEELKSPSDTTSIPCNN